MSGGSILSFGVVVESVRSGCRVQVRLRRRIFLDPCQHRADHCAAIDEERERDSKPPKSCDRPPQVRKLISADVAEPCPGTTSYQSSRPVTVRICGRKELERTCPPKLCDCPPKKPALSRRGIVGASTKLIAKGAIAGGLVYWTSAEGLWGDSSETEDLYYRMVETVAPVLPELPDLDEMKLPHLESMKHTIWEAYNHFVCSAIGGLVEIPAAIKKKILDSIFPNETDESGADGSGEAGNSKRSEETDGNV